VNGSGVRPNHYVTLRDNKGKPQEHASLIAAHLRFRLEQHAVFADIDDKAEFRACKLAEGGIYFYRDMIQAYSWISTPFNTLFHLIKIIYVHDRIMPYAHYARKAMCFSR
jgi:hypothetical protein